MYWSLGPTGTRVEAISGVSEGVALPKLTVPSVTTQRTPHVTAVHTWAVVDPSERALTRPVHRAQGPWPPGAIGKHGRASTR